MAKQELKQDMSEKQILIFGIKPSRKKAKSLAMLEVKSVLSDMKEADVIDGGPLSTRSGTFMAFLPACVSAGDLMPAFGRLGYIEQVDALVKSDDLNDAKEKVKWKGGLYDLESVYKDDKEKAREQAPDRRPFLLPDSAGQLRYVRGYRGDGTKTGRRALPVEDCRVLLNIAHLKKGQRVLDPFAGGGGIVFAARNFGLDVYSSDIDPILQYGLADYGARHAVASVEELPFQDAFFDSVVTEAPFDKNITPVIARGLEEIVRVTTARASIVMMTSEEQAQDIRDKARQLNLMAYADVSLDRKGTSVHIFAWRKSI